MIKVLHNAGFFSCCSVRLHCIVSYYNKYGILPVVDSSLQFEWYKNEQKDKSMQTDDTSTP